MNSSNLFSRLSSASTAAVKLLAEAKKAADRVSETAKAAAEHLSASKEHSAQKEGSAEDQSIVTDLPGDKSAAKKVLTESSSNSSVAVEKKEQKAVVTGRIAEGTEGGAAMVGDDIITVSGVIKIKKEKIQASDSILGADAVTNVETKEEGEAEIEGGKEGVKDAEGMTIVVNTQPATGGVDYMSRFRHIAFSPATSKMLAGHAQVEIISIGINVGVNSVREGGQVR